MSDKLIGRLVENHGRAAMIITGLLPQMGRLVLQDYGMLNDFLCEEARIKEALECEQEQHENIPEDLYDIPVYIGIASREGTVLSSAAFLNITTAAEAAAEARKFFQEDVEVRLMECRVRSVKLTTVEPEENGEKEK